MAENILDLNEQELRDKYGKLYTVAIDIEVDDATTVTRKYLFRKPSTISYDRYVKKCVGSPTKAAQDFACDNIIEEQLEDLKSDLEEFPAIALTINDKLLAMLGLAKDVSVKKF